MKNTKLATYSITHFLVDLTCSYFLIQSLHENGKYGAISIIVYNFCAFVLQLPIGCIADKISKNAVIASWGSLIVASGCFVKYLGILPLAIIIGIGNAMFHVGGGLDTLNESKEKITPLGIFVSTGALGLYFGSKYGYTDIFENILPIILSIFAVIIMTVDNGLGNNKFSIRLNKKSIQLLIICFAVVVIRSYVGLTYSMPWKKGTLAFITVLTVVLGKALGGLVADKIGIKNATIYSLGIASILYIFSSIPICGIMATLLFNMTMPLTLWIVSDTLPNAKGTMFGLLTTALFVGYVPVIFDIKLLSSGMDFGIISFISLILLEIAINKVTNTKSK